MKAVARTVRPSKIVVKTMSLMTPELPTKLISGSSLYDFKLSTSPDLIGGSNDGELPFAVGQPLARSTVGRGFILASSPSHLAVGLCVRQSGDGVVVLLRGVFTLLDWSAVIREPSLSLLGDYYLSTTPGVLSLTPSAQLVGQAMSPSTLNIVCQPIVSATEPTLVEVLADEPIPAFAAVTSNGRKANSNDQAHFQKVVGLALADIAVGFKGAVAMEGAEITNPLWTWTPGDVVFLNGDNLSTIAPITGFIQRIGTAASAAELLIELSEPIRL